MRTSRWSRPIFGPFRRKAKTGVPADHFPKAALMRDHGDGVTVLVADGPAVLIPDETSVMETWWFPTAEARQAFVDGTDAWAPETFSIGEVERQRLASEAEEHGGSREKIEGGVVAQLLTGVDLAHDKLTGPHTHTHAHGDGTEHSHGHFHNDSNVHNHGHAAAVKSGLSKLSVEARRRVDGGNEITDPTVLAAMVASAFDAHGGLDAWTALRETKGLTAAAGPDGTIVGAAWHAYLCAEGIRTDDGRELMPGACRFPDLPVSLRLLIEDEGGHWGAVTCGRIDSMERRELGPLQMIYSDGVFGSDPNGQLAELMVEEQTQRFVSIDPRDASAEWIEVEVRRSGSYDEEDAVMYDCWLRISDCVVGAATVVAMPALPQAVITLADVALPEAPIANAAAPPGLGDLEPAAVETVAASAAGLATSTTSYTAGDSVAIAPRREWFDDPSFYVGDPRLVLQSDGKSYACPLTISDPDPVTGLRRVFGHVAWWNCDHTAFPNKRIKPPHSDSGYAYYLTGPGVMCADGSRVEGVGQITMGCGHAPTFRVVGDRKVSVSAQEAISHYDGGYGAVQVADVRAGQDDFGPWVAGWIRADVTDKQLADFMALNLSGDWREIAGKLDMVAVLAVPVPGFPVRRALTAAGTPELDEASTIAAMQDGRVVALVAAGVVRRVDPLSRIAYLERHLTAAMSRIEQMEARWNAQTVSAAKARHGL